MRSVQIRTVLISISLRLAAGCGFAAGCASAGQCPISNGSESTRRRRGMSHWKGSLTILALLFAPSGFAQSPAQPAAAPAPAKPAALDPAALEKKVDELLRGHMTVNDFHGSVLLASGGKPLVAKGYGLAN